MSFLEAWANIGVGLVVSFVANHTLLPLVMGVPLSVAGNVALTAAYTGLSLVRSYALRRLFEARRMLSL